MLNLAFHKAYFKRYKEITSLLIRYGRQDLIRHAEFEVFIREDEYAIRSEARDLTNDLERMGPTFVKLGQLLSTRSDLLPPAYLEALARLQDEVAPFTFETAKKIIQRELGIKISRAFRSFNPMPIAAASLSQVHLAELHDGRQVAVKVQRPEIRSTIVQDFEALHFVANLVDQYTDVGRKYEFSRVLESLRLSLLEELDFCKEAQNLLIMQRIIRNFTSLVVPTPLMEYSTSRVLTMEYLPSVNLAVGVSTVAPEKRRIFAEDIFRAYLSQIVEEGFFHADPHPGNVRITEDGRLALLDLGMVGRLGPTVQEQLLQLILAVCEGRGEDAASVAIKMCQTKGESNRSRFVRELADLVTLNHKSGLADLNVGRVVMQISRIAAENGFRPPAEFTMAARTFLHIDTVVDLLDPDFRPDDSIKRNATALVTQRLSASLNRTHMLRTLLEAKEFVEQFPPRINQVLDSLANNNLTLRIEAANERMLLEALQKIANRITTGLVLAALIIGAALLARVPSTVTILGYPALAIIFFVFAAFGALLLVYNALFHDERPTHLRDV